jgi:hypothetical protein
MKKIIHFLLVIVLLLCAISSSTIAQSTFSAQKQVKLRNLSSKNIEILQELLNQITHSNSETERQRIKQKCLRLFAKNATTLDFINNGTSFLTIPELLDIVEQNRKDENNIQFYSPKSPYLLSGDKFETEGVFCNNNYCFTKIHFKIKDNLYTAETKIIGNTLLITSVVLSNGYTEKIYEISEQRVGKNKTNRLQRKTDVADIKNNLKATITAFIGTFNTIQENPELVEDLVQSAIENYLADPNERSISFNNTLFENPTSFFENTQLSAETSLKLKKLKVERFRSSPDYNALANIDFFYKKQKKIQLQYKFNIIATKQNQEWANKIDKIAITTRNKPLMVGLNFEITPNIVQSQFGIAIYAQPIGFFFNNYKKHKDQLPTDYLYSDQLSLITQQVATQPTNNYQALQYYDSNANLNTFNTGIYVKMPNFYKLSLLHLYLKGGVGVAKGAIWDIYKGNIRDYTLNNPLQEINNQQYLYAIDYYPISEVRPIVGIAAAITPPQIPLSFQIEATYSQLSQKIALSLGVGYAFHTQKNKRQQKMLRQFFPKL